MERYSQQPYARFERAGGDYWKLTHRGETREKLVGVDCPVPVAPEQPILRYPQVKVAKAVMTLDEYQERFFNFKNEMGWRLLLQEDLPMVKVNCFEAMGYADSIHGRLPTAEEWKDAKDMRVPVEGTGWEWVSCKEKARDLCGNFAVSDRVKRLLAEDKENLFKQEPAGELWDLYIGFRVITARNTSGTGLDFGNFDE